MIGSLAVWGGRIDRGHYRGSAGNVYPGGELSEKHKERYTYILRWKIVCYDAKSLLDKKVFEPLRNLDIFVNTRTVLNDHTCMGHFRE